MKSGDQERETALLRATVKAWRWHGHQTRKGKTAPYMSHLLQVQGLVLAYGGTTDQAVAALLHDALEDADSPRERAARETEIENEFGPAVLRIVLDCTDTTPRESLREKGPWKERKNRYLEQMADASAASALVAACDKLHNLGDLLGDLHLEGIRTFDRFSAGPTEQLWYFESVAGVLRGRIPVSLMAELERRVTELRENLR